MRFSCSREMERYIASVHWFRLDPLFTDQVVHDDKTAHDRVDSKNGTKESKKESLNRNIASADASKLRVGAS
jgi:hypothetical protein